MGANEEVQESGAGLLVVCVGRTDRRYGQRKEWYGSGAFWNNWETAMATPSRSIVIRSAGQNVGERYKRSYNLSRNFVEAVVTICIMSPIEYSWKGFRRIRIDENDSRIAISVTNFARRTGFGERKRWATVAIKTRSCDV
jgi:hypothetical protein